MGHDHRRVRWRVLVVVGVLCGLGGGVAWQVNDALGLRVRPAEVPVEQVRAAPARAVVAPPAIRSIVVSGDDRLRLAAGVVADAVAGRGAARPVIGDGPGPVLRVRLDAGLDGESYRIDGGVGLTVTAGTAAGAATGLYTLADRIRSGARVVADGTVVTPRLGLRLTDLGAVGLPDDPERYAEGADYSLNSDVVGEAILPDEPYVDEDAVARIADQFRRQVRHSLAQGYNAVVVPGFLEYVTFRDVGDGHAVYPAGDPHVARAEAMAAAFGPVWRYAHDLGMKVFLSTDMLALSPPLRAHLERTVGGLDTEDDRLWRVYRAGLAELFDRMSYVDGLMVRIGEGGAAYQLPGWDYTSEIAVTTPAAVRAMLRSFLAVAGEADREIIFRTWSVGIGEVGDLHTNKTAYERVFDGLDDDRLVVSTKYTLGDFYSHLPLNDTLLVGTQRRIVEFQSRREFEAFGSLPNDLGTLHKLALRRFLANPHVEGVWSWAQGGGPTLAGPRTLVLRTGFWQLYDLNSYLTGRLALDPDTDTAAATADWLRATFSDDPDTVAALGEVMALSREAITKGLYVVPYADQSVRALGLEPPPMMWIFEWDIVTGDSAVWDTIYTVNRDRPNLAVREGIDAVLVASDMRDLVADTDPATWRDPELRRHFMSTMDYQVSLFQTLGYYREARLRHAEWLDTGSAEAKGVWQDAAARYETHRAEHLDRYAGDLDLPAYNLTAADIGLDRAERDATMAWLARALLLLVLAVLALGSPWAARRVRTAPWARALWTASTRPWRLADLAGAPNRRDRVLVWAVPAAAVVAGRGILTSFAAPAHLVVVLGAWLLFTVALRLTLRRADPFALLAALGGVALLRTVLLLAVLAVRGPGYYWFGFWTEPTARTVYVTVAFAAFLAVFVCAYVVLRGAYGLSRAGTTGRVLVAAGVPLAVLGALVTALGAERALTMWNDQLALLPWGLSRILGITVHLEIPTGLPMVVTVAGAAVAFTGAALTFLGRARRPGVPL